MRIQAGNHLRQVHIKGQAKRTYESRNYQHRLILHLLIGRGSMAFLAGIQ